MNYKMDENLANCIRKDKEGSFHRSPMSNEDLEFIFTKPFTKPELEMFQKETHNKINALRKNSVNHRFDQIN